jgi:uncharacterized membrane protein
MQLLRPMLLLAMIGITFAAEPINRICPVLPDEPVDPAFQTKWNGHVVGLCCARCVRQFTANPQEYAANLVLPPAATLATTPPTTGDHADHAPPRVADSRVVMPAPMPTTGHGGHDHATGGHDHGPGSTAPRLVAWLGRFHPVIVHFPIALSLLAALAAVLGRFRASEPFKHTARVAMHGAAVTAVPAILLGWFAAAATPHPGLDAVLGWHRWLGTAAGAGLIAVAACTELAYRRTDGSRWAWPVVIGSVLMALVVGIVGHLGGILVFGPDHFAW